MKQEGYILVLALLFTSFSAPAAAEADIKASYPYAVLIEDTINMGIIERTDRVTAEIRLRNEGTPGLTIAKVRSSCGLMIPTWPTETIYTGEEAIIRFRYNANRLGRFERNIVIHTNAWQKTLVVPVYGEVIPVK